MVLNPNAPVYQEGNSNNGVAYSNSATIRALKNDPGLSFEWSAEEQSILEDGLRKYSSDKSPLRYAKIALLLQGKTVRDVALRCNWLSKKENAKKRKEDHNQSRKNKDKKEKTSDASTKVSSHLPARPNVPSYSPPLLHLDDDDDISYSDIGGISGQLLESNSIMFKKISGHLSNLQTEENLSLLSQARSNLLAVLNDMSDMPAVMNQMPPLPVKIDEELFNSILQRR